MTKRNRKSRLWDFELGTLDKYEEPHWLTGEAEENYLKHRQELAERVSQWEEDRMKWARQSLLTAEGRAAQRERNRRQNVVQRGLVPILRSVMQSWGLSMPITMTESSEPGGYTDFQSITIMHRPTRGERNDEGELVPFSSEEVSLIAGETRGVFYHEVGHNLFTVPMPYLWLLAWKENPRFSLPGLNTSPPNTKENAEHLTVGNVDVDAYFKNAWNVLEDCRMESKLVVESPMVAKYLTVLVLRLILSETNNYDPRLGWRDTGEPTASNYPLIGGRTYLPKAVRDAAAARWDAKYDSIATAAQVFDITARYRQATSPKAMLQAVADMRQIMIDLMQKAHGGSSPGVGEFDDHGSMGFLFEKDPSGRNQYKSFADEKLSNKVKGAATKVDGKEGPQGTSSKGAGEASKDGKGEGSKGENGSGQGQGQGPEACEGSDQLQGTEAGSGEGESGEGNFSDLVEQCLNATTEEWKKDATHQSDVQDMNTAYNEDDGALGYYEKIELATDQWQEDAERLSGEIEQAFRTATANCAPVWASGQTNGILEPIRYRTRQPGEREFYRSYADEGEPGQDLAVTLMLDVSGSMGGTGPALGAAAYAVKRAGDLLNIDTEVAVFETNGYLVWSNQDRPDSVPSIGARGSTYPEGLFQTLLEERRDKTRHIVIIMTDGGWGEHEIGASDLRNFAEDNRTIVLLGYGNCRDVEELMSRGPDEAYHIQDLFEIPALLENILVAMV